jgi:hypothetical protein
MNRVINIAASSRFFKRDFAYHPVRASMVLIFVLFGYQKWLEYEAQTLIPFIKYGPLTFWMGDVHHDGQHRPLHARLLERSSRVPGDARERGVPHERRSPSERGPVKVTDTGFGANQKQHRPFFDR